jgi:hypothetical protein
VTRDDIVRMAHEAGILMRSHEHQDEPTKLERFAALVAQHEREQCAKIVEHYTGAWSDEGYALTQAIRNRSEK